MNGAINRLRGIYLKRRQEILNRLLEFKRLGDSKDEDAIFAELCFCICTPQSKARAADKAITELRERSLIYKGSFDEILRVLRAAGVRFPDRKAEYIIEARKFKQMLKSLPNDPYEARELLVKNIKGIGMKEASHFLRNIGYGGLAILDRHILRGMLEVGVIEKIPKNLKRSLYYELEKRFLQLSESIGMKPEELDLVMWADKTGEIFK